MSIIILSRLVMGSSNVTDSKEIFMHSRLDFARSRCCFTHLKTRGVAPVVPSQQPRIPQETGAAPPEINAGGRRASRRP